MNFEVTWLYNKQNNARKRNHNVIAITFHMLFFIIEMFPGHEAMTSALKKEFKAPVI
ncbi:hypothetical protein [Pseudoalteromonas sp. NBT06-2]|uniref:hypothetical protein n=1 Tax=Pseudoalteromonas sp. NBT06-2 TaxID=2025950 RepID=UPI001482BD12|nr:hypothetical protein [Pseudoalteromonas sp. NBT06-2]